MGCKKYALKSHNGFLRYQQDRTANLALFWFCPQNSIMGFLFLAHF
jgi:hypothetical protein